ncbi:hypothetical protein VNI00_006678 [Paramarasmius palmivorus]|uniref:Uncharacterized protein n=1 Tax=Paramarasmius palmivorus TaxID=297713 RepID=A0AAW0D8K7_9AGAR
MPQTFNVGSSGPNSCHQTDLLESLVASLQSGAVLPPELASSILHFVSSTTDEPGPSRPTPTLISQLPTPPASQANSIPATPLRNTTPSPPSSPSRRFVFSRTAEDSPTKIETNARASTRSICDKLYYYENGAYIEYPETSKNGIGYLIKCDPDNWHSPFEDIAYSLGGRKSVKGNTKPLRHRLIGNGNIDCVHRYKTCEGIKACPFTDPEEVKAPHLVASRELIQERLLRDYELRQEDDCPSREVFEKTVAFVQSLQRVGCLLDQDEDPVAYAPTEEQAILDQHHEVLRRGYTPSKPHCPGRIIASEDQRGFLVVKCEFHSDNCRLHFYQVVDESLNSTYVHAVLSGDKETAKHIEENVASELSVGPGTNACKWVANHSSQRKNCPYAHRDPTTGVLFCPKMDTVECDVKFHTYTPTEEFRDQFPYTLLIVRGTHTHLPPLPTKTPPRLRAQILGLLGSMTEELSELTPRRLLRHPLICSHLKMVFPDKPNATLGDLHPSLANHSHIRSFIKTVKNEVFPEGTGWEGKLDTLFTVASFNKSILGALHLYEVQMQTFPVESQYIRHIQQFSNQELQDVECTGSDGLHLIVCMSREGSLRLQKTRYGQSDISFKRINGIWLEFIIAGRDRLTNAAVVFCRVYVTLQSAAAHFRIFQTVENIVRGDTGLPIKWRHLYASSNNEVDQEGLLLMWTGDQDGGQAKGLGMHLQSIAQTLPGYDLYEPQRKLSDLGPYEHLHRLFRVCNVHFARNIRKCPVSRRVRNAMSSLACIEHSDWEGTLQLIRTEGGRAGIDWLENKIQSQFALQAICWKQSKIPLYVWKAGDSNDNLVEASHANVNLEGKSCTLVGGIESGRRFDFNRMGLLQVYETVGIRRSYYTNHATDSATKAIKRKHSQNHENFKEPDRAILKHNELFEKTESRINDARTKGNKIRTEIAKLLDQLINLESKHKHEFDPIQKGKLQEQIETKNKKIDNEKERMNRQLKAFNKSRDELRQLSEDAGKLRSGSGKYIPRTLIPT